MQKKLPQVSHIKRSIWCDIVCGSIGTKDGSPQGGFLGTIGKQVHVPFDLFPLFQSDLFRSSNMLLLEPQYNPVLPAKIHLLLNVFPWLAHRFKLTQRNGIDRLLVLGLK